MEAPTLYPRLPAVLRRHVRRVLESVLCVLILATHAGVAPAQDLATARRDVGEAEDFRLRMAAALALGKAKPPDARALLEKALSDAHPAVRTAAAAALSLLGDPAAVPALEQRLLSEGSGSVKSQMRASLDILKRRGASMAAPTKYFVQLGAMKNLTNVRGDQLGHVLRVAVHERAAAIPGAMPARP